MKAQSTPLLHAAFDQLVGKGRWRRRSDLGGFAVRFPSPDDPGEACRCQLSRPVGEYDAPSEPLADSTAQSFGSCLM
jgi:hypothetical protein